MSRCNICNRIKAVEKDYITIPQGEGEHLCWGEWSPQQCHQEAVDWQEKYDQLLFSFKQLDKHNDVLYRCYITAKKLPNIQKELAEAILEVERFENDLHANRKKESRSLEENESGRYMVG